MSNKSWYNRKHQFTPYTKADGQAVSDEFDAIQTSFERIPEMRDDGKGFKDSPLIPEPTDPMHPVPLKMLTETEKSVNNARDDVTDKAQQVAQNTQSVAANTLIATQKSDTATQAAASAQSSQQAAGNYENMAHKWAANPVNEIVQGDQYSAYHYATKAAQSETTASSAAIKSKNNADIATSKAEEAVQAAKKAKSIADGEVEYEKILNVPNAGTQTKGVIQLTNDTGLESESLALTAKAGKKLAQLIATVQLALNNYIPLNKRSSAVNSESEDNLATSKAAKIAYDKGIEAKTAADNAQRTANDGVSKANAAQTSANQAKSAADNAQRTANDANNNANNRVSKSGDTMTGLLSVPKIHLTENSTGESLKFGDDAWLGDADVSNAVGVKGQQNPEQGYIAYGANKKRFGFDGANFVAESGLGAQWFGSQKRGEGAYVQQWQTEAPYYVDAGNANGSSTYFPYLKGKVLNGDGWGSALSFGYTTPGTRNQFGAGIIHLIEDNGREKWWEFAHDGNFRSAADVVTSSGKSLNNTHQQSYDYVQATSSGNYGGLSILKPDGKSMRFEREGNAFKFWNQDMYSILMPERGGTVALTSDVVSDIRLGALVTKRLFRNLNSEGEVGAGYIVTGFRDIGDRFDNAIGVFRPIQKHINGQWITVYNA